MSAAQTLGPAYAAELQKTPNDPEGAWKRAWTQAEISGAFSGASWAVFPARFFQGPVKQLVFQTFGVQPALAVAEKTTRNVVEGKPASGPGGLQEFMSPGQRKAYIANPARGSRFLGTAVHNATNAALQKAYPKRFPYQRIGPDFTDKTTGEVIELTTPGQVAGHLAKPGYNAVTTSTYVLPKNP